MENQMIKQPKMIQLCKRDHTVHIDVIVSSLTDDIREMQDIAQEILTIAQMDINKEENKSDLPPLESDTHV